MSYEVELVDENGMLVTVDSFEDGGTYPVGGSTTASLNVTYNYGVFFYKHLCPILGLRCLDGQTAERTIPALQAASGRARNRPRPELLGSYARECGSSPRTAPLLGTGAPKGDVEGGVDARNEQRRTNRRALMKTGIGLGTLEVVK